jgi:Zn-dependent M16 (insulinase) family peptidase
MTKEILLLKQYSALVDKLQALRELLVKKQNDYVLMYNSRERHKALYTNLLNSITKHCEDLKDTIVYKA